MHHFTTSRGIKFICSDYEDGTEVGAIQIATIGDLREFMRFVDEETAGGPVLLREQPTLLLNGASLRVDYDRSLPPGAIHYVSEGSRRVLKAGGADVSGSSLSDAPGGGAGGSGESTAAQQVPWES